MKKLYMYLHVGSLAWVIFLIRFLPNSDFLKKNESNDWLYLIVDALVVVPIIVMIVIVSRITQTSE